MARKFSVEQFMTGKIPGDLTLIEVGDWLSTTPEFKDIKASTIRFLLLPERTEFDRLTTLQEFRRFAEVGRAVIAISDGSGGQPVFEIT